MTAFWFSAALLALVAVALLGFPLWRDRRASGRWSLTGIATVIVIAPVAVLLYQHVTTYSDTAQELPAGVSQEQADVVAQLAERMNENPDDVEGWRLLGRSYMALEQYARARRAFIEAWERSPVKDNQLKLEMAESMIFTDRTTFADAAELIDDVLSSEPTNQKALWYGGLVAMQGGREDVALARWSALLETDPPPELADMLRSQIASISRGGPQASAGAQQEPAADGPTIELDVRLGDTVSLDAFGAQAALFIFAREPGGGPPVAAIRAPIDSVPGTFSLSDADAMLPDRSLADYDELMLVARISASGEPTEQPGDYYAQATYGADQTGSVELVIDQEVR